MPATKTPHDKKISWNQKGPGGHMFGGVSTLGEYFVSKDRAGCSTGRLVFLPLDGPPVEVEVEDKTGDLEADLYWSMTNHNKALLGIDTDVEDYWRYPRP